MWCTWKPSACRSTLGEGLFFARGRTKCARLQSAAMCAKQRSTLEQTIMHASHTSAPVSAQALRTTSNHRSASLARPLSPLGAAERRNDAALPRPELCPSPHAPGLLPIAFATSFKSKSRKATHCNLCFRHRWRTARNRSLPVTLWVWLLHPTRLGQRQLPPSASSLLNGADPWIEAEAGARGEGLNWRRRQARQLPSTLQWPVAPTSAIFLPPNSLPYSPRGCRAA